MVFKCNHSSDDVFNGLPRVQKISFGAMQEYLRCWDVGNGHFDCNGGNQSAADFINIPFTSGVTEGWLSGYSQGKTGNASICGPCRQDRGNRIPLKNADGFIQY